MKIEQIVLLENEQLDELSWKDVQKGAKKIQKGAEKFQKNVSTTGDAVAGAVNAVGGAGKELAKQTIARPVGAAYNAVKSAAGAAANTVANTYGDVKKGVQNVGQGIATAQSDLGNAAKFAGQRAADAIGGVGQAVGAVASVPQGVGRATKAGYNAGVQAIGGPDQDAAQPAASTPQAAAQTAAQTAAQVTGAEGGQSSAQLDQQIAQLEKQLTSLKAQARQARAGEAQTRQLAQTQQAGEKQAGGENMLTKAVNGVADAWNKGVGMGATGQSVANQSYGTKATDQGDSVKVKDAQGQEHSYKKVGQQWFDKDNKPVDAATAAMLANQAKQSQAQTPAPAQDTQQTQQPEPVAQQGKDVQGRMAKQLGAAPSGIPAQDNKPAAQNFGQRANGYSSTTYAQPTGIPQVGGAQPTTGAKAVPVQQPAAPAQTKVVSGGPTPAEREQLNKRIQSAQAQPVAETDYSAMLAHKAKVRL